MANPNMGDWFKSKMDEIADIIHDTADDAAVMGETLTKTYIETRGTAKSGKTGRIETGEMLNSVSGKVSDVTPVSATAEFGWLEGTPEYAKYQEYGTETIEKMYALGDASHEVIEDVKDNLRSKLRGL